MIRDDKGQVSIEFILIVGAVLTIVIVTIPMILKNAEMSRGLAAARDGATYGASMRGLGYAGSGVSQQPSGIVKIINITLEYQNKTAGLDWYRIRFYVSAPSKMIDNPTCSSSSIGNTIRRQSISYINYAFHGAYLNTFGPVDGSYYRFTTACSFV